MIHVKSENRDYYPYVLYTEQGPVPGLDPRSAPEVVADWLARAKRGSQRQALEARAAIRAGIHNEQALARRTRNEGEIPGADPDPVTLDEVQAPPAVVVDMDEVLTLSGLPGGYGYASFLATEVIGVTRAGGGDADDFCQGVPEYVDFSRRGGEGRGKKGKKGRGR